MGQVGQWVGDTWNAIRLHYLVVAFVVALAVALAAPRPGVVVQRPQVLGVHVVEFINIVIVVSNCVSCSSCPDQRGVARRSG